MIEYLPFLLGQFRSLLILLIFLYPLFVLFVIVRCIFAVGEPSGLRLIILTVLAFAGIKLVFMDLQLFWNFWRMALNLATLACLPAIGWEAFQWWHFGFWKKS